MGLESGSSRVFVAVLLRIAQRVLRVGLRLLGPTVLAFERLRQSLQNLLAYRLLGNLLEILLVLSDLSFEQLLVLLDLDKLSLHLELVAWFPAFLLAASAVRRGGHLEKVYLLGAGRCLHRVTHVGAVCLD